ncbi:apolipoprotein D-like [Stegostoma tigrinum]|uniref:apolipoprotein D-like n=1 Tax=Stegostoma tigrinum TaxID=3053191 RepID=UPI00202B08D4|nr:apolipoprotein D-like [Stegostoma tigrinum]XP_048397845.1 apolipoprotein D-like [Stegostoma tigrinum]XP_048397846.1 apolipoprotein D-like [Stegostoma tigrinum]
MQRLILVLFVFSICFTKGSLKSCPKLPVQRNFTLSEFMGTWYEIKALSTRFLRGSCITHTFAKNSNLWINVNTTEKKDDGKRILYIGKLTVARLNESANLQVRWADGGHLGFVVESDEFSFIPFQILASDCTSYSLVYSCTQHNLYPTIYAWILSRHAYLEESTIDQLENILKDHKIKLDKIHTIDQQNCP